MSSSTFQSLDATEQKNESLPTESLDIEENPLDVLSSSSSSSESSSSSPAPRFPTTGRVRKENNDNGFTEDDKKDFLEIYNKFNKFGTGVIPSSELGSVMKNYSRN